LDQTAPDDLLPSAAKPERAPLTRDQVERMRLAQSGMGASPVAKLRQQQADRERRDRVRVAIGAWAGAGAALVASAAGAVVFREDISEMWPNAAGAFAAVGLDVNVYGLEFSDLDIDRTFEGPTPVLVVKGAVRTSRLMSDGRRQIGDFHYEGDLFGLECGDTHAFSAEALGECIILMVKRSALRASGAAESLDRLIWDTTVRDLRRAQEHVMLLGRKTACERVASFLLNLADNADNSAIDLPMGRQDMADYLGLTIETVSRMLTQLQGSSVVEFTCARKFRVRNPAALARLAD
jgi:CRP/FNR family nitrogen fixation transcriptional regulator